MAAFVQIAPLSPFPCFTSTTTTTTTIAFSFHAPFLSFFRPQFSSLCSQSLSSSLLSSTTDRHPFLPLKKTTSRRKLQCKPPHGELVKATTQDSLVKKMTGKEVENLIKQERNVPLILHFYGTWCAACIFQTSELKKVSDAIQQEQVSLNKYLLRISSTVCVVHLRGQNIFAEESNAMIVEVDTDEELDFACDMQVRGVPTLYIISPDPSKNAIRLDGAHEVSQMTEVIDTYT